MVTRKVVIGDTAQRSKPGPGSVEIQSQPIEVDFTEGKTGRRIAAAMKNAIQAGIRAIDAPVSDATLAKREGQSGGRALETWIEGAAAGRKKRKRKHLGTATWGNDTGTLADKLRVHWIPETQTVTLYETKADPTRLNPEPFGSRYTAFRTKLMQLVRELNDPEHLWTRPNVQKTIALVTRDMIKVKPKKKSFSSWLKGAGRGNRQSGYFRSSR